MQRVVVRVSTCACISHAPSGLAPLPHLRRDWARPGHICTRTGLAPCHICAGTGLAPAPHTARQASLGLLAVKGPLRCCYCPSLQRPQRWLHRRRFALFDRVRRPVSGVMVSCVRARALVHDRMCVAVRMRACVCVRGRGRGRANARFAVGASSCCCAAASLPCIGSAGGPRASGRMPSQQGQALVG